MPEISQHPCPDCGGRVVISIAFPGKAYSKCDACGLMWVRESTGWVSAARAEYSNENLEVRRG